MKPLLPTIIALLCLTLCPAFAGHNQRQAAKKQPRSTDVSSPQPRPWFVKALRIIGLIAGIYVCLLVLMLFFKDRFIYHPVRYSAKNWEKPGSVDECWMETEDGLRLNAWWRPADAPENAPTLLWLHGNAGNITHRSESLAMFPDSLNILLIDYRGYGKSQGHPSEEGLYMDGEAGYRYLINERDVSPDRIIAYGRSLGTTVALDVALRQRVAALILESPFCSAGDMAQHMFPFIPGRLLLSDRFNNVSRIAELDVPLLVVHGKKDRIVPFKQGRAVYDAAPQPKDFLPLPAAGHNDIHTVGGTQYFQQLLAFCRKYTTQDPPPQD